MFPPPTPPPGSPIFPIKLEPGETYQHIGYINCCISMEKKTEGKIFFKEPGNCLTVKSIPSGEAVWENICEHTVKVYKSLPPERYFTFEKGDKYNIGIGASETVHSCTNKKIYFYKKK